MHHDLFDINHQWVLLLLQDPDYGVAALEGGATVGLILGLLVLWLVLVVVGFAVKTLFWLAIVGLVLFLATGVLGALRGRSGRSALR